MKVRKLAAILTAAALCLGLFAGCGSSSSSSEDASAAEEVEEAAEEESAEEPEEAPEASEEPEEAEEPEEPEEPEEASEEMEEPEAPEEPEEPEEPEDTGYTVPGTAAIAALENGEIDQSCELPLTTEETTLSYWCTTNFGGNVAISSWSEHYGLQLAQDHTGVTLNIHECNMTVANEQFSLMLASNDLCDIVVGFEEMYSPGVDDAIENDLVVNLLDHLDAAPVYAQLLDADPDWKANIQSEGGNIISFKTLYTKFSWIGQSIAVRGDWLDDLGLDVPSTYDEYHAVLTAFKNEYDPSYCLNIGSSLGNSWFESGFGVAVSADGSATTADFYVEDGVVHDGYTSDRFLAYVTMLHAWYEEGLISNDYVTIGNLEFFENDYSALIAAGEFGCVMGAGGLLGSYASMSDDEDFEMVPSYTPRSAEDPTLCYLTPSSYTGTDTAPSVARQSENVDLAISFLDYFYTEEGVELANYGIRGESFDYDENGEPQLSELITSAGDVSAALTPYKVNIATISDPNAQTRAMMTEEACEIMQFWTEDQTDLINQGNNAYYPTDVAFTASEMEDATSTLADIATYVSESIPKFIMGSTDLSEWDSYCQAIEDMGIADVVAIYQAGYDRYTA